MNKVFKVIWSEARNAYVVVSEIAKNHGSKSCSTKKLLTMLIATGVMTCASMAPAMAGNPAPDDLNVTIGNGAHISVWNGSTGQNINGDIAVGPNAHAWNGEYSYTDPFSKRVYPRIGSKEYLMDFGQGAVENVIDLSIKPHYKVVDGSKIAGSIAIGKNTIARTGSVMLGDHSYTGKLGDVEINPKDAMTYNDGIYSTTLGAGAYNSGSLAAVTGALSIASGKKDKDTQNTGATIYGSLNSIESATNDSNYSGVASSVLGFANRTQNANAALIWGTGNEVTNSIEDVKGIDFKKWSSQSVSDAQKDAIEAMQSSKYAGGSVLAIGGGNKADYAKYSQLTGVQNKVTGTKSENAKYDFVNGYQNIVKDASDVTVIGTKNEVTADGNKVIGDNHQVSGKNNVIFGSVKELTETTVNNAVVLGYNAKVTGEGGVVLGYNAKVTGKDGVALGAGSVADRANAVSVGSSVKGNKITRQIINVAEGTEDTDAVNVSQLHQTNENVAELDNRVTANEKAIAQNKADIATNAENIKQNATDIAQNKNDIKNLDNRVTNVEELAKKHTTVTAGDNIVVSEDTNKDGGKEYKVALDKDINLDSVTTGDTTITDKGLEIKDGPSVTKDGINAGDKKITGVADGDIKEGSTDA
ncbi:ESPR-type extended signal peptide-containing protein, partial [uncultured Phascolarctobacterium sp.]|uniref:ESPR domain-containing protein n=1 Tax=uncultured Phascolarctobacterium sp. TaxID=512296 RepID=UPI0027D9CB2B